MPRIRLEVDRETFEALLDLAARERRDPYEQGAVTLRVALGLPFPYPPLTADELCQAGLPVPVTP